MTPISLRSLLLASAAVALVSFAVATFAMAQPLPPVPPVPPMPPMVENIGEQFTETFDLDKDGAITRAELDQALRNDVTQADADRDGGLNPAEFAAFEAARAARRNEERFKRADWNGDGRITADELADRPRDTFRMLDRDADGTVTAEELKDIRIERIHMRRDGEGRGHGRH